ncbi:Flagellar hook-associated protein 1 [Sodalis glossinidius str. 'morsitans']|uniref:Flagellar hook-associated protein 1 n=1 Tax=Sodalis glossinidius (strain morsitans) TaxID=343509 RepID=Q2NX11_SODGM|nr:flagellar hook-associated protein FlgK [Sodalis glossinidius]BAE73314.1 flagellar hook-associated protein 1 FlgK [Sodalis glossinidius str. 'morsitans']CRL43633.1 Flagellar hook-associated protein 1 [Sodalis glossinidius str. 'morsitans']
MLNLYYIASSGLQTGQQALSVIGNNLANATNPYYSRQNIILGAAGGRVTSTGHIGNGVRVEGVARAFDEYANERVRGTETLLRASSAHYDKMSSLDLEFSRTDNGIDTKLNSLFNALKDISTVPKNSNYRSSAFTALKELTGRFNKLSDELSKQEQKNNQDIRQSVNNINQLTGQLASLNREISNRQSIDGGGAYDLLDRRDALLQALSQQTGINTQIDSRTGAVNVTLSNGHMLVSGDKANALEVTTDNNNPGRQVIAYRDAENAIIPLQDSLLDKGVLGGLLAFHNQDLPEIRDRLNELALHLSNRFNQVNKQGYDDNGKEGEDLFSYALPNSIANGRNQGEASLSVTGLNTDPDAVGGVAKPQDYTLRFENGTWQVKGTADGRKVESTFVDDKLTFEGVTVAVEGDPQEGDSYQLNPFNGIADSVAVSIKNGDEIAAASKKEPQDTDGKETGNNGNSIALGNIQHEKLINGATLSDAYAGLIGYVGTTTLNLRETSSSQEKAFQDAYVERSEKTGVNLNQEYVQMEMFRQYYNASAQVLQTANSLLDTLLTIR